MDGDQQCPRCKTTKYRNPSLKLMVNTCGHSLCESCIELLFIRGSGACPECGIPLRRSNFRVQLFEDAYVEKELDQRRRILKEFNKKEEDFQTLREYNDYLEQIETIVYNLTNNVDVESTKKMVEQYKKDNKDIIMKNKSRLSKDDEYLSMLIEQEHELSSSYKTHNKEEEMREKLHKLKNKQALIDELMLSEGAADAILARHKASIETETPNTGPYQKPVFTTERGFVPECMPMQLDVSPAYEYSEFTLETCGPATPSTQDITDGEYLLHIRRASSQELAGGYRTSYGCRRALMDAFNGLTLAVHPPPSIEDPA